MHRLPLLSALAGASLVLADPVISAAPFALQRRQTESKECQSAADLVLRGQPYIDPDGPLAAWFGSRADSIFTTETDFPDPTSACTLQFPAATDVPADLSSAYVSFLSETAAWASRAEPTITSLAQSCGGELSDWLEIHLATDFDTCISRFGKYRAAYESTMTTSTDIASGLPTATPPTATPAPTGSTSTPQPTETGTGGGAAGAAATTSQSTAGAPRETGYIVAAAAVVVAAAGAVAAL